MNLLKIRKDENGRKTGQGKVGAGSGWEPKLFASEVATGSPSYDQSSKLVVGGQTLNFFKLTLYIEFSKF